MQKEIYKCVYKAWCVSLITKDSYTAMELYNTVDYSQLAGSYIRQSFFNLAMYKMFQNAVASCFALFLHYFFLITYFYYTDTWNKSLK